MALWMNQGKINLTLNSKNVVGVGTAFLTSAVPARPGQPLVVNGVIMEIATVTSDTTMTLALNYTGATATNLAYFILTTMEGSYNDLARRAAQVMGYFQGYMDVYQTLFTGTGNVTVTMPDGTVATLPTWAEKSKIESIQAGVMNGPMSVANMKGAIKVDGQRSISYQDQAGTKFHNFAIGNVWRIAAGNNGELPLFDFAGSVLEAYTVFYTKGGLISRNSTKTNWLGMETPENADPYISAKAYNIGANAIAIQFPNNSVEFPLKVVFKNSVMSTYNAPRSWTSYGSANFTCAEFTGSVGNLHASLSHPFKITGTYGVDMFVGTYAETANASNLFHILGCTDGGTYNPGWWLGNGGNLRYYSSSASVAVGTINSSSPMTGPSFTPTSDSRLKPVELREAIEEASSFLRKQKPMYFFKKYAIDSEQGFYEFGFIADLVEKDEPRLVFETNDENKLKHLAITGMIPHVVKGWQEHDARLGAVEDLLKDIDKRLKAAGI